MDLLILLLLAVDEIRALGENLQSQLLHPQFSLQAEGLVLVFGVQSHPHKCPTQEVEHPSITDPSLDGALVQKNRTHIEISLRLYIINEEDIHFMAALDIDDFVDFVLDNTSGDRCNLAVQDVDERDGLFDEMVFGEISDQDILAGHHGIGGPDFIDHGAQHKEIMDCDQFGFIELRVALQDFFVGSDAAVVFDEARSVQSE